MSDSDDGINADLFQEPENFFKPPPEPTFATHTLLSGKELKLRLVGHNPLWVGQRSIPVLCHYSSSDVEAPRFGVAVVHDDL